MFCTFFNLYDFLSLKNEVNVPSKSNKQKNVCIAVLKATDENSRFRSLIYKVRGMDLGIRIRIPTKMSRIPNTAAKSD
jgi:hypothetical protein